MSHQFNLHDQRTYGNSKITKTSYQSHCRAPVHKQTKTLEFQTGAEQITDKRTKASDITNSVDETQYYLTIVGTSSMEYKLREASATMAHGRPISWMTTTTAPSSENNNSFLEVGVYTTLGNSSLKKTRSNENSRRQKKSRQVADKDEGLDLPIYSRHMTSTRSTTQFARLMKTVI